MDVWVVGAGGLLGSSIARATQGDVSVRLFDADPVPWSIPTDATHALGENLERFQRWRRSGVPWAIIWAAGAGVIASTPERLTAEGQVLLGFSQSVADSASGDGSFIFASSASVYGDHGNAICDESSSTFPRNAYARTKRDQEEALAQILGGRISLVQARLATLYGPGQDLSKGQGLVSTMCNEALSGRTVSIFVPLDTQRDYLFTADASAQVLSLAHAASRMTSTRPEVRVLGSYRSVTIGEVARTVQIVSRQRTRLLQIQTPSSTLHVRRQLLTSRDPILRTSRKTSLLAGISAVYRDLLGNYITAR